MNDEVKRAVRIRSLAYAGAAACFALILVLVPLVKPDSWHFVALPLAAWGLPSFVAAGWMAEWSLRYGRCVTLGSTTELSDSPIIHMITSGSLGLIGSISVELWSADIASGATFTLGLLIAMRMVSVHRSRIKSAIENSENSTQQNT
jgi:hypothetical protein